MSSNQRQSFRTGFNTRAELFHRGAVAPCMIVNMSAGGMLLQAGASVAEGDQLTLGLRLYDDLKSAAGTDYLSFHLEVLEVSEVEGETGTTWLLRCRNMTSEGSPLYERAVKVVFEAERRRVAAQTGSDESSPMARDREREKARRPDPVDRFGKASVNPLHNQ